MITWLNFWYQTYLQNILLARKVIKQHFTLSLLLKLICILHHREGLVNFHAARCEQSSDNKPWIIQRCNSIHRITPKLKCLYLHRNSLSIKKPNTKPGFAMHCFYQHFLKLKGWVEIAWKLALPVKVMRKRAMSYTRAAQLQMTVTGHKGMEQSWTGKAQVGHEENVLH